MRRIFYAFVVFLLFTVAGIDGIAASDVSIPGVSSKYNTEELIDKTMEAERKPLERMEDRKDEYAQQKQAWSTVNERLSSVAENANTLYGYENPFQNYIADSTDPDVLSATANRTASESIESIKVLQTAKRDTFQSKSLPEDYNVPEGEYGFSLGDREVSFSYKGGDLDDFAKAVRNRAKGLVTAKTVRNTPNTRVIVFEGGETGKDNTLSFLEDSASFGTDSGILKKNVAKELSLQPSTENVAAWKDSSSSSFTVSDGKVDVEPQGAAEIDISPEIDLKENLEMRINVQIENIPKDEYTPPSPPPGPSVPSQDGVELEGIEILNEQSKVQLPEWEAPEPPEEVDTLDVLSVNGTHNLEELQDTEEPQTITLDSSAFEDTISSLVIHNENTHRKIRIGEIEVLDPDARGDYSPARASSKAADAKLEVDGVTVDRPTNEIDDLITGVTLNPKRASNREVELQIEPDREEIKETLFTFVGSYNRALTEINILTSRQEAVIEEISYFEDGEEEEAREKLGLFQGESTFTQLKSRMQRIMTAPYETSAGDELSMLSQMGISTNAGGSGESVSRSRLRGYLELDESKLDSVLESNLSAVKELFGSDTDGDRSVDSGIAYEMNRFLRTYTQRGGLISNRIAGIDNRIDNTEDDMSNLNDRLERKEQDLKRKYGRMENNLGELEKEREAIEGFDSQNNR
ncbi:MAG: flagellar filament capping protein FliD [Spirochaetaceae bacterium]